MQTYPDAGPGELGAESSVFVAVEGDEVVQGGERVPPGDEEATVVPGPDPIVPHLVTVTHCSKE